MSHPSFSAYLRHEVAQLRQAAEVQSSQAQQAAHGTPTDFQSEYTRRVREWLHSLSPVQRVRRYATDEVILLASLEGLGGTGKRPRLGMVGVALRACGMAPRRDWTASGRNRRYWAIDEREAVR